ncbi:glycosyltransferase [Rhodococcus sp. IEGM 1408]|uniref:glycosyltransferase n=1 Tax=Rhodococcus sp. IEGM 1408 TaxID=3082220 RepID=UPI00295496F5|nr:glycosyltransferase [Rhodococcus sp. IEGM 1408]MDV8000648.1 glycosyltransferase [Rhodococcus sp. IEGM 1408]
MVDHPPPAPVRSRSRVSIVIPCFNYARYLDAAINSALAQPDVDLEVIVADNCSTDGSLDLARRRAAADSRIRVTTQPYNKPYLENYNEALAAATSEFVTVLDADDLLTPGSITRSVALLQAHPDVAFTYGYCRPFEDSPPEPKIGRTRWVVWNGPEWLDRFMRMGRNVILSPEVLVRRSVLEAAGWFDTDFPSGADMLLWLRCATLGGVGRVDGPDQALYRIHGSNMHYEESTGQLLEDLRSRARVFEHFLDHDAPRLPEIDRWRSEYRRAVADYAIRNAFVAFDSGSEQGRTVGTGSAALAEELLPEIVGERRWKQLMRRRDGAYPLWRRRLDVAARVVRHRSATLLRRRLER